ncbi:mitochondrial carrier domain-containing protein [Entophlyctis helioformis]|nr:mitochondrial carrier domain-containing protein [Entophlyctis helioformis]
MSQPAATRPDRPAYPVERWIGFLAGLLSGATKLVVGHPFDTIKVRMQTQGGHGRFKGPLDCLVTTVRKEGFRALYKGATPPLLGWAIMDSVQMGSLNNFRLCLQGDDPSVKLTSVQQGIAGIGAGVVVSFVATPIELLKGRLQVQYDAATKTYSGPLDCARQIIRADGSCLMFRSFFWVLWGSYDVYTNELNKMGVNSSMVPFFAGALAANTFWTISFPADAIKNRIMTHPANLPRLTIRECARRMYRAEGIRGFYRGFLPSFLRSAPTNGAAVLVYETVFKHGKQWWIEEDLV